MNVPFLVSRSSSRRNHARGDHDAHTRQTASGLINTSQQVGGAVGLALLSTIAVSTTEDKLAGGAAGPSALTNGLANAFWAGAAIAFAGLLVSIFLVRGRDLRAQEEEVHEPALEEAALEEAA